MRPTLLVGVALLACSTAVLAPAALADEAALPQNCEQGALACYCDDAVQADGSWNRCRSHLATPAGTVHGPGPGVGGGYDPEAGSESAARQDCHPVGPVNFPLGEPRYRIGG